MSATIKAFRVLSDATRLRLMSLLAAEELSVHELQEITRMGQSRISTHLGMLQDAGLVEQQVAPERVTARDSCATPLR